jgi:hypothetical protein
VKTQVFQCTEVVTMVGWDVVARAALAGACRWWGDAAAAQVNFGEWSGRHHGSA